jgi:hypothetical protein
MESVMRLDNGTRVEVVVPFGPSAGQVTARGVIEGVRHSGMDGTTYYVREQGGEVVEHSESWVRRA